MSYVHIVGCSMVNRSLACIIHMSVWSILYRFDNMGRRELLCFNAYVVDIIAASRTLLPCICVTTTSNPGNISHVQSLWIAMDTYAMMHSSRFYAMLYIYAFISLNPTTPTAIPTPPSHTHSYTHATKNTHVPFVNINFERCQMSDVSSVSSFTPKTHSKQYRVTRVHSNVDINVMYN